MGSVGLEERQCCHLGTRSMGERYGARPGVDKETGGGMVAVGTSTEALLGRPPALEGKEVQEEEVVGWLRAMSQGHCSPPCYHPPHPPSTAASPPAPSGDLRPCRFHNKPRRHAAHQHNKPLWRLLALPLPGHDPNGMRPTSAVCWVILAWFMGHKAAASSKNIGHIHSKWDQIKQVHPLGGKLSVLVFIKKTSVCLFRKKKNDSLSQQHSPFENKEAKQKAGNLV